MRRLAAWIAAAALMLLVAVVEAPATAADGSANAERARPQDPAPPRLPANFRARGRWVVRSLGITVPFTWRSENGNSRMVAGGKHYPIWFVNLIYHNRLYTLTYKWPGVDDHRCVLFPGYFTRQHAQRGPARIAVRRPRGPAGQTRTAASTTGGSASSSPSCRRATTSGSRSRSPTSTSGRATGRAGGSCSSSAFQNLFDPELDEWGMLDRFRLEPAPVSLPNRCPPPSTPT